MRIVSSACQKPRARNLLAIAEFMWRVVGAYAGDDALAQRTAQRLTVFGGLYRRVALYQGLARGVVVVGEEQMGDNGLARDVGIVPKRNEQSFSGIKPSSFAVVRWAMWRRVPCALANFTASDELA